MLYDREYRTVDGIIFDTREEADIAKDNVQLQSQVVVVLFVCVLYFNLYVCLAPEVSIREDIICKAYYDGLDNDGDSTLEYPGRDCTVDAVQRELSLISQVYITITQLPGEQQSSSSALVTCAKCLSLTFWTN